jgi:hypothetical protein
MRFHKGAKGPIEMAVDTGPLEEFSSFDTLQKLFFRDEEVILTVFLVRSLRPRRAGNGKDHVVQPFENLFDYTGFSRTGRTTDDEKLSFH